jgi:hypothetical protein
MFGSVWILVAQFFFNLKHLYSVAAVHVLVINVYARESE